MPPDVDAKMLECPGPFCNSAGITALALLDNDGIPEHVQKSAFPQNGLVLELCKFATLHKLPSNKVACWLKNIFPQCFECSTKTLESRISRTLAIGKQIKRNRKNAMFKTFEQFQNAKFIVNSRSIGNEQNDVFLSENKNEEQHSARESSSQIPVNTKCSPNPQQDTVIHNPITVLPPSVIDKVCLSKPSQEKDMCNILPPPSLVIVEDKFIPNSPHETKTPNSQTQTYSPILSRETVTQKRSDTEKLSNTVQYEIFKHQKILKKLKNLVDSEQETLKQLKAVKGHFSIRNVTKRDETASKNRKLLRKTQFKVIQQKKEIEYHLLKDKESQTSINDLKLENVMLKRENSALSSEISKKTQIERTKLNAQRLNSYYRKTLKKIRESNNPPSSQSKSEILEKDALIQKLQIENDILSEKVQEINSCRNKNADGTYTNNLRLCVIELFGLEVAVEKISSAISVVSKLLFDCEFHKTDLPNRTTIQNIVDEGHFIAKTYIAEQIDNSESWGLNRDGTTRKKQKIVDTSVTLDSGDILSLGFTQVAHETAAAITEVTKNHMTELATVYNNQYEGNDKSRPVNVTEGYISSSLEKLAFSMSDRASNEKLADKLLTEWRDEVLSECESEEQKRTVHHFHCMAHVLLGFHKYICDDLKKLEKKNVEVEGPVGRDTLPAFKFWSKKGTVIERVLRTTSDIFGPAGDHHGLRDRWQSYCSNKGIKSVIGNYKDNRFNGLFQTAGEICVHYEDFLTVLKTVNSPNLKLQSVQADLESETVKMYLHCFAFLFIKVTGPYWTLITSGSVSYLELYPYIQNLEQYLHKCISNPSFLLQKSSSWISSDFENPPNYQRISSALTSISYSEKLLELVSLSCNAMLRTVTKQLADFLEGGMYSTAPTKEDLRATSYAQVTNLGCEHHFGDLDSSQKRRPNASMHHHSTVQLIKRNGKRIMNWLERMPEKRRELIMKNARKGGKELRKRHNTHEENVSSTLYKEMFEKKTFAKKRKKDDMEAEEDYGEADEQCTLTSLLPTIKKFKDNDYVAVAYQDNWYPGCIVSSFDNDTALINFMTPCRKAGTFMWPSRKDVQEVKKQFVIMCNLLPECCNSGRQWYFPEHDKIKMIYLKYKEHFF